MAEPRRVLHVAQPTTAGVPTVLLGYLRDQLERGWDVAVACPPDTGWLAAEAGRAGARGLPWHADRAPGPSLAGEVRRLRELVATEQPDILHLHSSKAGLVGRFGHHGRHRTVFQPHAWSFLAVGKMLRAPAVRWERCAARRTDALICVSAAERAAGVALGIAPATWTVPNGVDGSQFVPTDRAAARADLGLGATPTVLCIGRLCEQKGQRDLLAAWPTVRRAVPDARLVLVGDGPDRAALTAAAAGLAGVDLVGEQRDPVRWYAAADVVAVPSRWEGMALVPLEAMACGRSVVVTDVAGAETVLPGAGAVVRQRDVSALAEALVMRLADPTRCGVEGAAGRAHVLSKHDLARAAADVAQIYQDVLDHSTGDPVPVAKEG
jgi:glycosyltransferase involved in cell wall biosynthesis